MVAAPVTGTDYAHVTYEAPAAKLSVTNEAPGIGRAATTEVPSLDSADGAATDTAAQAGARLPVPPGKARRAAAPGRPAVLIRSKSPRAPGDQ